MALRFYAFAFLCCYLMLQNLPTDTLWRHRGLSALESIEAREKLALEIQGAQLLQVLVLAIGQQHSVGPTLLA